MLYLTTWKYEEVAQFTEHYLKSVYIWTIYIYYEQSILNTASIYTRKIMKIYF